MGFEIGKCKVLVTGANGQLGSEIREFVENGKWEIENGDFYFSDRSEVDIADFKAVEEFCRKNSITHIINCASYTAVDRAEEERELCEKINFLAVKNLAEIAKEKNISLIHISTDYVFDGKNHKPYLEDDKTDPINHYGLTKLKGEEAIKSINPKNSIIIRTSWVYSRYGNNFVKTMLKLTSELQEIRVIYDQVGTPTYAKDLAEVILQIVNVKSEMLNKKENNQISNNVEIYHYSNEGVCSWYDFAHEIIKIKGYKCKVVPICTKEYPTPAKRPHISMLDKTKIKKDFGVEIAYWRDSLEKMLDVGC